jgi:hypothetical protein
MYGIVLAPPDRMIGRRGRVAADAAADDGVYTARPTSTMTTVGRLTDRHAARDREAARPRGTTKPQASADTPARPPGPLVLLRQIALQQAPGAGEHHVAVDRGVLVGDSHAGELAREPSALGARDHQRDITEGERT